jgi:hypothetical protein
MHDIDRAMFESELEAQEGVGETHESFETESYESLESSHEADSREMEMAARLLEVSSEEELEDFLGNLLSSAASAARGFANSAAGRALGGVLKGAARQALPQLGQVLGNAIAPGAGGQLGQRAGRWLGSQFEFEGLSAEDREFEAARAFVRVADEAARRVQQMGAAPDPEQAAQSALAAAARRSLPGLIPLVAASGPQRQGAGRWIRHGNRIVLFGA